MVKINEDLSKLLKSHPFFKGMDKKSRKTISGCAKNEVVKAGEYLFKEGLDADKFYLIREGLVTLELHVPGRENMVLETRHAGEILGWSWLVKPYVWNFDARALEKTRLISLDAKCLRTKMEKDHTLAYDLFKRFIPVMGDRLEASRLRLIDLYGTPVAPDDKKAGEG